MGRCRWGKGWPWKLAMQTWKNKYFWTGKCSPTVRHRAWTPTLVSRRAGTARNDCSVFHSSSRRLNRDRRFGIRKHRPHLPIYRMSIESVRNRARTKATKADLGRRCQDKRPVAQTVQHRRSIRKKVEARLWQFPSPPAIARAGDAMARQSRFLRRESLISNWARS